MGLRKFFIGKSQKMALDNSTRRHAEPVINTLEIELISATKSLKKAV